MISPFARNVFNYSYFNTSTYDLWHLTPAYIFELYTDKVDVYTFCKAYLLLGLLSVLSGTRRFTSETILNDLDNFSNFILCY